MSYRSVEEIFESFNNLKVLIIGDVMVDAYIWGVVERISPEAPVPVVRTTKRDFRLGGAANVALNVQSLGATPLLCAVVGDDESGKRFIGRLQEKAISAEGIVVSDSRPTTVKTRVMTSHQHVVRVDEETDALLNKKEEAAVTQKIEELIQKADVVIFEDYDKGVLSKGLIAKAVDMARAKGIPTVVDPKKRNFLHYKKVTFFKPNLKELKEGLKVDFEKHDQKAIEKSVEQLTQKLESEGSLITLSERGVFISYKGEKHLVPAHMREISDVSGAGDTVISIAAMCVALGLPPFLIAALSNLGGGLVCEHIGVVPINKDSLLKEASKQGWI
ncbi:bifunctional heptose 7-phosphate kinase/heptose 1-phosphate adenyltransferase [Fulvivirga sediminis]|uniref:D-glycero-beta-D-manno-heptose-7-phosphate kinase n=1 Tax=Fulvivirga sediminis TaxID=2803949 RepID=A0A937F5R8_9BACT|nr:bifunctional ADP-heptose synthase [Fulvivirga sediminis]MBL3656886.1 D-glycero-beta-D-manno-heptose-7-phosphate kinase [Fulvivirga sediminis]